MLQTICYDMTNDMTWWSR